MFRKVSTLFLAFQLLLLVGMVGCVGSSSAAHRSGGSPERCLIGRNEMRPGGGSLYNLPGRSEEGEIPEQDARAAERSIGADTTSPRYRDQSRRR